MRQQAQLKSSLLLLLAAFIWGFAFVAQRQGMEHTGPFTFNAVRFILGAVSLLPLIWIMDRRSGQTKEQVRTSYRSASRYGLCTGLVLFIGASLQQVGLMYTTAGKAAFVTGLYIVIVPFFGLFLKQRLGVNSAIGAVLAVIGLYLLCMTDDLTLGKGDLYELVGAFFWSVHILLIDRFSRKTDGLKLSLVQIVTCSALSFIVAFATEKVELSGLSDAIIPLLYGGICSVGIAYTLQIVGQKNAHPTQAAIILSLETVFAAIGGYLLLDEVLGVRAGIGCLFMLVGMIVPQLPPVKRRVVISSGKKKKSA
ncbi:DMT family transporter [Paenibacillus glycanilyticus]|uniref:Permease n=1 Tax=Paenibacillus glycanilyticus TaxID=126569 RepID=A0ABQ6GL70_9BACL|nr:DMT family transporter [Paenibacillus glycanilyticus]GLX70352.1 permease [Paenibacillus glycanilyticus]